MTTILITYSSFSGTTKSVAENIKSFLESKTCNVAIRSADGTKSDLSMYDLIILGSAIQGDQPHPKIGAFIEANRMELIQKKIAVFVVCSTITSSKETRRQNALNYPDKVAHGLKLVSKAVFGGNIPSSGKIGNRLGKMILGITPGDYRDWIEIQQWVDSLYTLMVSEKFVNTHIFSF